MDRRNAEEKQGREKKGLTEKGLEAAEALLTQIADSTSPFMAVEYVKRELTAAGFRSLALNEEWQLRAGGRYFVPAYDRTLFAFTVGEETGTRTRLRIAAAHTDFPCFKIKPLPEITALGCRKLNVEPYGGMIRSTWMDRPLSISGKAALRTDDPFAPKSVLVDFRRPVCTIPNLAIHMNRKVNDGVSLDPQKDLLPLADLSDGETTESFFLQEMAGEIGCAPEDILEYEMFLYQWEAGTLAGFGNTLLSSPRLDNITSLRACVQGLLQGKRREGLNLIALFDNEEVGSHSKQGAASALLPFVLERIYQAFGSSREQLLTDLPDGFFLSLDVAHAAHPNVPEKADIVNRPVLGGGVTLKLSASQSYANDCEAAAAVQSLCERAGIPYQRFVNRSDMRGGGTLGSIASAGLPMRTMDAGISILAMHSARELMAARDQLALERLVQALFS
ncbi:MAG: M18 family aminopeptidase [Lachnospiraceae bacterium]|nr:M18 family aminopeptidase [Lachnospiraceae bacterium]